MLNPPPQNTNQAGFLETLARSVFQIFAAIGGGGKPPTLFDLTDTPTTNPGWSTSSTVNMTAPDGYIKVNVGGQDVVIPYWNT